MNELIGVLSWSFLFAWFSFCLFVLVWNFSHCCLMSFSKARSGQSPYLRRPEYSCLTQKISVPVRLPLNDIQVFLNILKTSKYDAGINGVTCTVCLLSQLLCPRIRYLHFHTKYPSDNGTNFFKTENAINDTCCQNLHFLHLKCTVRRQYCTPLIKKRPCE